MSKELSSHGKKLNRHERRSNQRAERTGNTLRPYGNRIIKTVIRGDREWQLHATKGWRVYRK
jgi:hypothetical protein